MTRSISVLLSLAACTLLAACAESDAPPNTMPTKTAPTAPADVIDGPAEEDVIDPADLTLDELEAEVNRLERESVPADGTPLADVEARFGEGTPFALSKGAVDVPPDAPRRTHSITEDGTMYVWYDAEWRVSNAQFIYPHGRKGTRAGVAIPEAARRRGAEARLAWMRRIHAEIRRRFP